MPPKKNKGKQPKGPPVLEEIDMTGLSQPEMLQLLFQLWDAIETQKKERNSFLREKNKIHEYILLVNRDIVKARREARLVQSRAEELKREAEVDAGVERERCRADAWELSGETKMAAVNSATFVVRENDLLGGEENLLREDLTQRTTDIWEQEERFRALRRETECKHVARKMEARERYLMEVDDERNTRVPWEEKFLKETEEEREAEIQDINERKEAFLRRLLESHQNEMLEIQKVYENIISHNFFKINELKRRLNSEKEEDIKACKRLRENEASNNHLKSEMEDLKHKTIIIREQLDDEKQAKRQLVKLKKKLTAIEEEREHRMLERELVIKLIEEETKPLEELKRGTEEVAMTGALNVGRKAIYLTRRIQAVKAAGEDSKALLRAVKAGLLEGFQGQKVMTPSRIQLNRAVALCNSLKMTQNNLINLYEIVLKKEHIGFSSIGLIPRGKIF